MHGHTHWIPPSFLPPWSYSWLYWEHWGNPRLQSGSSVQDLQLCSTRSKTILETMENNANTVGCVFKDGDAGAFTSMKSGAVHGELSVCLAYLPSAWKANQQVCDPPQKPLIKVVCRMVLMLISPIKPKIQSMCNQHLYLELCGIIFIKNSKIYILDWLNFSHDLSIGEGPCNGWSGKFQTEY